MKPQDLNQPLACQARQSMPESACPCVSGLMYRDALTTAAAANLGAFVRLIFIYPPHETSKRGRELLRQYYARKRPWQVS